jgi:lipoprotein-anchoring transpeptidase ErfK/SrfK
MDSSRRRGFSTRWLTVLVTAFAIIAVAMVAVLAMAVVLGPRSASPATQFGTPVPAATSALGGAGRTEPDLSQTTGNENETGWFVASTVRAPSPFVAKPVVPGGELRPKWTATPLPTSTPVPSPTPNPTFVSSAYGLGNYMPEGISRNERWIDVSLGEQKLVAYEGLVPVFETLVSTGTASHPTVTGQFRIWLRFTSQDMDGYRLGYNYYLRNVPYVQYFYEDYSLHGTYWHNNFGTPMSHGCVNLATPDAEWLYNWAGYGTLVNIHP